MLMSSMRERVVGAVALLMAVALTGMAATNQVAASESEGRLIEAWQEAGSSGAMPVKEMTLPVAHYDDGTVRALLRAKEALIPPNDKGPVRARGVVVEMFSEKGLFEGVFIADKLFYDRNTNDSYCEEAVRLEWRDIKITGSNMVWNLETRNAKILSHPKVELNRFMEGIGEAFR